MTTKLSGVGRYVKGGIGNLAGEFAVAIDRFEFAVAEWRYEYFEEECRDCLDRKGICSTCMQQFIADGWQPPRPYAPFKVTVKH